LKSGASRSHAFYEYDSSRRRRDWNACGQAAVAALLDLHGAQLPGMTKTVPDACDGRLRWEPGAAIDRVRASYPPDFFFGLFGTSPERLAAALRGFGLDAEIRRAWGREAGDRIFAGAKREAAEGRPPVLIMDRRHLGGRPLAAHWGILLGVEDGVARLGNMGRGPREVPEASLRRAFSCRFMGPRFSQCAVLCEPGAAGSRPSSEPGRPGGDHTR